MEGKMRPHLLSDAVINPSFREKGCAGVLWAKRSGENGLEETVKKMSLGGWEEADLLGRGKIWEKKIPSGSRKGRGDGGAGRAMAPA